MAIVERIILYLDAMPKTGDRGKMPDWSYLQKKAKLSPAMTARP